MKISLSNNTIDQDDMERLIGWLRSNPRLTQGQKVREFETAFAKKVGSRYAVFVNSGSSANLIMLYALKVMGKLKHNRVAVPSLCWATDVSPLIQLGITPVLLNSGGGLIQNKYTIQNIANCDAFLCVSVLGLVEDYDLIRDKCDKENVILIEDACESLMSSYKEKMVGTFGLMGTYSFYFSHHISTIEGGMVVTDDEECYTILKMLRSHGWSRDIDKSRANMLKTMFNVSDFNEQFTFYIPGFNVRGTDLQATIGIEQLKKLDHLAKIRNENFYHYENNMPDSVKFDIEKNGFICNFGYPIVVDNRDKMAKYLTANGVECRPLISGAMSRQPMWTQFAPNSEHDGQMDYITDLGMYLPNHHGMGEKEIKYICNLIKKVIK